MRRVHTRRSPPLRAALFNIIAGGHLASSHDDTTEGAMHYFQDEVGKYLTLPEFLLACLLKRAIIHNHSCEQCMVSVSLIWDGNYGVYSLFCVFVFSKRC